MTNMNFTFGLASIGVDLKSRNVNVMNVRLMLMFFNVRFFL